MRVFAVPVCFILLCIFCFCSSCQDKSVIAEAYHDLPKGVWSYDSIAAFRFSHQELENVPMRLDVHVRYSDLYPFYNLYIRYTLLSGADTLIKDKIADLTLMHPDSGEPFGVTSRATGSGPGSLFLVSVPVEKNLSFLNRTDSCTLLISQYMRADSLPGIYGIGYKLLRTDLVK